MLDSGVTVRPAPVRWLPGAGLTIAACCAMAATETADSRLQRARTVRFTGFSLRRLRTGPVTVCADLVAPAWALVAMAPSAPSKSHRNLNPEGSRPPERNAMGGEPGFKGSTLGVLIRRRMHYLAHVANQEADKEPDGQCNGVLAGRGAGYGAVLRLPQAGRPGKRLSDKICEKHITRKTT